MGANTRAPTNDQRCASEGIGNSTSRRGDFWDNEIAEGLCQLVEAGYSTQHETNPALDANRAAITDKSENSRDNGRGSSALGHPSLLEYLLEHQIDQLTREEPTKPGWPQLLDGTLSSNEARAPAQLLEPKNSSDTRGA